MTDKTSLSQRLPFYDVLRGLALVAMTIYHFTWDLEFFGWLLPGKTLEPGWVLFARCIATSFLFLVGFSLVLAHGNGIRWKGFWKRFFQVATAALLISIVTYAAFEGPRIAGEFMAGYAPQKANVTVTSDFGVQVIDGLANVTWSPKGTGFIFFGILHGIALASLIAIVFVRLHWIFAAAGALAVLAIWKWIALPVFSNPALWWVGLAPVAPVSNDYVPMFPWLAPVLFGVVAAKLLTDLGKINAIGTLSFPSIAKRPLSFIGRHSLVYYLLHQPVMLALVWAFTAVAGAPDKTPAFVQLCTQQCEDFNNEAFCRNYCSCTAEGLKREKLFVLFHEGKVNIRKDPKAQGVIKQCTADNKHLLEADKKPKDKK